MGTRENFYEMVDCRINVLRCQCAASPEKFVFDWIADDPKLGADLIKIYALNYHDPCELGHQIRRYMDNQLRIAAEFIVETERMDRSH
ncbi:MAG TPA: hypothetical protein DEP05_09290 [Betaproteobacteria bacterium]|nr:hypothetical protein [Betaproteobacteria bacterium]